MKFKKGDILIDKLNKNTRILIVKCSLIFNTYKYRYIDSENRILFNNPTTLFSEYCSNLENVCDFCPDYIRKKKLKKILR